MSRVLLRSGRLTFALVIAFALLVAALLAPPANAIVTEDIIYAVKPPVGSGDPGRAQLNCGWHSSCSEGAGYPTGLGLDWDDDELPSNTFNDSYGDGQGTCCLSGTKSDNVYARAWVYRTTYTKMMDVMEIQAFQNNGVCKTVSDRMWIWDTTTGKGALLGSVDWQHTNFAASAEWFAVTASGQGLYNRAQVGDMINTKPEELPACQSLWDGKHVHEEHVPAAGITGWSSGTGFPQGDDCNQNIENGTFCTEVRNHPARSTAATTRKVRYPRPLSACEIADVQDLCGGIVTNAAPMTTTPIDESPD